MLFTVVDVRRLWLMLDVRQREEQREAAWRANDELAWRRITGSPPVAGAERVVNPQDAVLREGANIVADMGELQHS